MNLGLWIALIIFVAYVLLTGYRVERLQKKVADLEDEVSGHKSDIYWLEVGEDLIGERVEKLDPDDDDDNSAQGEIENSSLNR